MNPEGTRPLRILLTGQCTLHWGRMEYGNIGNYYIAEPLVRELHRAFPGAEIRTTFQFSDDFCQRELVVRLPMALYYGWTGHDLEDARGELAATRAAGGTPLGPRSPFIAEVQQCDLVIDFSGDIFGDNADLLGPGRFEVGLCKLRTAQLLGKPTALIAGSPGPFSAPATRALVDEVLAGCSLVTTREELSLQILRETGCDTTRIPALACPAFLFDSRCAVPAVASTIQQMRDSASGRPVVGFVLCGWNFRHGPFDRWPRTDDEFLPFVEGLECLANELGAAVYLISHANGFHPPPAEFRLHHGRDFPIAQQLLSVFRRRGGAAAPVFTLGSVHPASETHAILGSLDFLVSGRVHAAVAALAQQVPTTIIDYGHEPKAHKLRGFARVAGVDDCVADPRTYGDIVSKIRTCWADRAALRSRLAKRIPLVRELARRHIDQLPPLLAAPAARITTS